MMGLNLSDLKADEQEIFLLLSHDTTDVSSGVFDQARHKPACAATETS